MPGPLAGVKIVDCSAYITGPFAAMMLADQGADVVKVEPTGLGDVMRYLGTERGGISTLFAGCNRSKRSLALNLREERGLEVLRKLVAGADVFLQNYRPGVAERLGIGEADLRAVKPDLVYASLSAFGADGPMAGRPAFDHVVQALSGMAAVQSDLETGRPGFVRNAVIDKLTALTTAQAITAALLHRERTGEGQHLELSMLSSALNFLWPDGMGRDTLQGHGVTLRPPVSASYRMTELKDGHMAVAAVTLEQVHGLMRAVGKPEFIEDERFSTPNALLANLDVFEAELAEIAAEQTLDESLANFEREDVPGAPVLSPAEVPEHPQVRAMDLVEEVEHPAMGAMLRPRPPVRFSRSPAGVSRHAPQLGEHGDEILSELGFGPAEREELRAKGIVG
jgi:crotonobetainyl-CoA:carnitine CoA-transferase CaiB-like acyl-CoA transferase